MDRPEDCGLPSAEQGGAYAEHIWFESIEIENDVMIYLKRWTLSHALEQLIYSSVNIKDCQRLRTCNFNS